MVFLVPYVRFDDFCTESAGFVEVCLILCARQYILSNESSSPYARRGTFGFQRLPNILQFCCKDKKGLICLLSLWMSLTSKRRAVL